MKEGRGSSVNWVPQINTMVVSWWQKGAAESRQGGELPGVLKDGWVGKWSLRVNPNE